MEIVLAILALVIGGGVGYGANTYVSKQKAQDNDKKAKKALEEAKEEAKKKILEAKEEALKVAEEAKKEERERRTKLDASENAWQTVKLCLIASLIKLKSVPKLLTRVKKKSKPSKKKFELSELAKKTTFKRSPSLKKPMPKRS